ncbi:MAG: gamma-glutamylcyclotransferase [Candidatus Competibacteraceae bacterium]|nr:gamma-glutamylcyclotransferase [Candidatus Competibacteraceae bacterium]
MLYFSYGSNMSVCRLLKRVPSAKFVATASLNEHDLRFHKKSKDGSSKCDAYYTGNSGHSIIGVIFEIPETEKPELDRKEGLGNGYEEKEVMLTTPAGEQIKALTYYATNIDETLRPYQWYKYHVLTGAKENGLPDFYLKKLENIKSIQDPKQERYDREMAIYAGKNSSTHIFC